MLIVQVSALNVAYMYLAQYRNSYNILVILIVSDMSGEGKSIAGAYRVQVYLYEEGGGPPAGGLRYLHKINIFWMKKKLEKSILNQL